MGRIKVENLGPSGKTVQTRALYQSPKQQDGYGDQGSQ
jgi:hypothetical protein